MARKMAFGTVVKKKQRNVKRQDKGVVVAQNSVHE